MKKIIAILSVLTICFALTGCSCASNKKESSPDVQTQSDREVGSEYMWD